MVEPVKYLKKSMDKGVVYPHEIALNFVEKYTPKQVALKVNKTLGGRDYVNYSEINRVRKKIEVQQKKIEDPESSSVDKKKLATTNIVAESILDYFIAKKPSTKCEWLASSSSNPSLDHVANYGELFYLDEGIDGDLPGRRPNCQCGFRIIED